jgi:integrase
MINKRFTDTYIKNLKPCSVRKDYTDGNGFYVRVFPSGKKAFWFRYKINQKSKRLTLGQYPGVTLKEAKEIYQKAYDIKSKGKDPAIHLQTSEDNSFKALFELFFEHRSTKKNDEGVEDRRVVQLDVLPEIGNLRAGDVTRAEITDILDKIMARGAERQANITLDKINAIFNFGLDRQFPGLTANPSHKMKPPGTEKIGTRVLNAKEISQFWYGIESGLISDKTIRALRLNLITGQRIGECTSLEYKEIEGDWWTIPGRKTKNNQEHRVFLTKTAKEIIGKGQGFVFPDKTGKTYKNKCQPGNAIRRLFKPTKSGHIRLSMAKWTPRDLRRTTATGLATIGYSDELIDRFLNHKPSVLSRTYNKHIYDEEKKEMAIAWEKNVIGLLKKSAQKKQ